MPIKDPEKRKAYHRQLMRDLRQAEEYRAKEAEQAAAYYAAHKDKLRPARLAWKKSEKGKKLYREWARRKFATDPVYRDKVRKKNRAYWDKLKADPIKHAAHLKAKKVYDAARRKAKLAELSNASASVARRSNGER